MSINRSKIVSIFLVLSICSNLLLIYFLARGGRSIPSSASIIGSEISESEVPLKSVESETSGKTTKIESEIYKKEVSLSAQDNENIDTATDSKKVYDQEERFQYFTFQVPSEWLVDYAVDDTFVDSFLLAESPDFKEKSKTNERYYYSCNPNRKIKNAILQGARIVGVLDYSFSVVQETMNRMLSQCKNVISRKSITVKGINDEKFEGILTHFKDIFFESGESYEAIISYHQNLFIVRMDFDPKTFNNPEEFILKVLDSFKILKIRKPKWS